MDTNEIYISVIIAVYNVENYIERCLHSLFNQTFKNLEYIFVNDGSTDSSMEILERIINQYPYRKKYIKIINHEKNLGIAAARTSGLLASSGSYVICCDPDDYIELKMYEMLYNEAIQSKADIIVCNIKYIYNSKESYIRNFNYKGDSATYLSNGIFTDFGYASMFNKLIKRKIIIENQIYPFPNCNYGEDLGFIMRVLYYSKDISSVNIALYNYCIRPDSLSNSVLSKYNLNQRINIVNNISSFFEEKGFKVLINYLKFITKLEIKKLYKNDKEWFYLYKECHKDIFKFKTNSLKSRLFCYIWLKNYLIYKIINKLMPKLTHI